MGPRDLPPVQPGEILLVDFLKPLNITRYRLAKRLGVPAHLDVSCSLLVIRFRNSPKGPFFTFRLNHSISSAGVMSLIFS
jgi:hypothetical protein